MHIEESGFEEAVRLCGDRLGYVHIGESHRSGLTPTQVFLLFVYVAVVTCVCYTAMDWLGSQDVRKVMRLQHHSMLVATRITAILLDGLVCELLTARHTLPLLAN